jgi:hypothetical protein
LGEQRQQHHQEQQEQGSNLKVQTTSQPIAAKRETREGGARIACRPGCKAGKRMMQQQQQQQQR